MDDDVEKYFFRRVKYVTFALFVCTVVLLGFSCRSAQPATEFSASSFHPELLKAGEILFTAQHEENVQGPMKIFVVNADGTDLQAFTDDAGYLTLDVERLPDDGWRIAYTKLTNVMNGQIVTLEVFDSSTGLVSTITEQRQYGNRPTLNADASLVAYQAFSSAFQSNSGKSPVGGGINIWLAKADGSDTPVALTNVAPPFNAEWPSFHPKKDEIFHFVNTLVPALREVRDMNGTLLYRIQPPGGMTVSDIAFHPSGDEFVSAQTLTSYYFPSGNFGSLNDLKKTSSIMSQLAEFGYREVPSSDVSGLGAGGTFGLSIDWSRDGASLVFDAFVEQVTTGKRGAAIFVYHIPSDTLKLIYGPEPVDPSVNNDYSFSVFTPKWIP